MGFTSPSSLIKRSFRAKIFAMAALFIITMSCAFTIFFIGYHTQNQTNELFRQGKLLANLLANSSRLPVFAGNQVAVEKAAEEMVLNPNVISVSIFGKNGDLLTHRVKPGEKSRLDVQGTPERTHVSNDENTVSVTVPIIAEVAQFTAGTLFLDSGKPVAMQIGSVTMLLDKENLNAEIRQLILFAISSMFLFLLLASILAYLMARGLTRPLSALMEGVNALGNQGTCPSVPVTTEDEIGGLAAAFNSMADNLQRRDHEKRQLEEQLRQAQEQDAQKEWERTFDTVPDLIVILDNEQRIVRINRAMTDHLQCSKDMLIGRQCQEVSDNCCLMQQFYPNGHDTATGTSAECEVYEEKSGTWYWLTVSTLHRSEWAGAGTVHVARDITLRKKAESEKKTMQAKLIQTNKMASLGLLVSGMAHEVNNPNSNIMFTAHLLSKAWKDAESVLDRYLREEGDFRLGGHSYSQIRESLPYHIAGITENARRIEGIIKNLKDFVRKGRAELTPDVDVNRVISVSASLIGNQIKKHTSCFEMQLADSLPVVRGNSQQLEQVVINVIMNALQALPEKSRYVRIVSAHEPASAYVTVRIEDEGYGMTPEVKASVFEPFFSTKLDSGGTGLGLPISKFILDEHDGQMEIASEPGKGTTVTIFLPVGQGKSARATLTAA